jgi:hypothetical protein
LSQGEYRDFAQAAAPVAGTYWGDVAYITERVLTVDELKAFVDALPAAREATPSTDDGFWSSSFSPVANLRALLARRLVRDGRLGEALAYFPPPVAGSTSDQPNGDRATVDDARDYRPRSRRPPRLAIRLAVADGRSCGSPVQSGHAYPPAGHGADGDGRTA